MITLFSFAVALAIQVSAPSINTAVPETEHTISINNINAVDEDDSYEGIKFFHGTWEEALKKAKTEGKHIFLDAYAVWCGPCKLMARQTFPKKDVGEYFNSHFINVKMDMERGEGLALSKKYEIKAYPTLLIINHKGDEVGRTLGYKKPTGLIGFGKEFSEQ